MSYTDLPQHAKTPLLILMADDDAEDRMLAKEALAEGHLNIELSTVEDGEELLNYLLHKGRYADKNKYPAPGLILLDLNMPRKDGREALKEIKANERLKHIPVVVLTTSKAEEDILKTYSLGVNSYITKPVNFTSLVNLMKTVCSYWFEVVALPAK